MRLKSLRRFLVLNMNDPNWGGGGGGQPPRRPDGDGPPDLDEIWNGFWQDFNRRFGVGNRGNGNNDGGMRPPAQGDGKGGSGGGAYGPSVVGAVLGIGLLLWLASGFFIV